MPTPEGRTVFASRALSPLFIPPGPLLIPELMAEPELANEEAPPMEGGIAAGCDPVDVIVSPDPELAGVRVELAADGAGAPAYDCCGLCVKLHRFCGESLFPRHQTQEAQAEGEPGRLTLDGAVNIFHKRSPEPPGPFVVPPANACACPKEKLHFSITARPETLDVQVAIYAERNTCGAAFAGLGRGGAAWAG